ncbi:MAG: putative acetyltransferase [Flavobacteriales bacterium]|jgi:putative acetyltransferase
MKIRKIEKTDNKELAKMLKTVLTEVGANADGFAFTDPQLDNMFEYYDTQIGNYYVVVNNEGTIIGGAGIGALDGETSTMELQKMYFLPETRGKGIAQKLLDHLMLEAKENGFQQCYLETLDGLDAALALYRRNGFTLIDKPLGNTGHFGCNVYMLKSL